MVSPLGSLVKNRLLKRYPLHFKNVFGLENCLRIKKVSLWVFRHYENFLKEKVPGFFGFTNKNVHLAILVML